MNATIDRIKEFFPEAAPYNEVLPAYLQKLQQERQLDLDKCISAYSLCPDELNNVVMEEIRRIFGNTFPLGGVTGYPFAGATGFNAFGDHIPDEGTAFIFYGPHMGIDGEENGYVRRPGQERKTLSCGAALGAYSDLVKAPDKAPQIDDDDYQIGRVKKMFYPHLQYIPLVNPELSLLDIVMEESRAFMLTQARRIKQKFQAKEIYLLAGTVLNTPADMPDYIQVNYFDIV